MKRIVIVSLIIAFFSSIIFFIIALNQSNEFVALKKTIVAFPAFCVVIIAIMLIVEFIRPSSSKNKEKNVIRNTDYIFKDVEKRKP
ncbi:MAG: hypothetical protein M0R46_02630 [Candidatus Muirbacterium halophilum]|nr:hypothetical protein [Candidatus Muirbacterium halophilum]MCK9474786.1 hypothetical protein [Candidatus Muirbacterium halophilum]